MIRKCAKSNFDVMRYYSGYIQDVTICHLKWCIYEKKNYSRNKCQDWNRLLWNKANLVYKLFLFEYYPIIAVKMQMK